MAKAKKRPDRDKAFKKFAERSPEMTVLTDQPLTPEQAEELFERDPFNFLYKLGPVYDILRYKNPKDKDRDSLTPMAILISGGWGTGKTTAMKWLHGLLDKWNKNPTDGAKVRPVWFYPWKYDKKEDVWRGLIAEVILNAMTKEADAKTIVEAFKTAAIFIGKSALDLANATTVKLGNFEISGEVLKKVKDNLKDATYPEKPYLNPYEKTIEDWLNKSLGDKERMVIFIDDLDRCMPDIALQVLEALKLYLNTEKLIFVVGVDKEVVEKLVVKHYENLGLVEAKDKTADEDEKKQRERNEAKAKQYLSKMFQVEVELSPTEGQIREFFDEHLPPIPYPQKTPANLKNLFQRVILRLAGRNPRELKRILNGALMAAAGVKFIKRKEGEPKFTFEQGLQSFFVRRIVQTQFPSIAEMLDTDKGRNFFMDWSRILIELTKEQQGPDRHGRPAETED